MEASRAAQYSGKHLNAAGARIMKYLPIAFITVLPLIISIAFLFFDPFNKTLGPWGVLIAGLILPSLIWTYLILRIRKADAVSRTNEALRHEISERLQSEKRLAKLHECLFNFGADPVRNINRLTALCGEVLGASCALYNRLEKGFLCSWGQWQVPEDFISKCEPEGYICFDTIKGGTENVLVVRDLDTSAYAQSDPHVKAYNLKTYVGKPVKFDGEYVGALCVVYQSDFLPDDNDISFLSVVASAIGVEEKRKFAEDALLRRNEQLRVLVKAAKEINMFLEVPLIMRKLSALAMELVGAGAGAAALVIERKMVFTEFNSHGKITPVHYRFAAGSGIPGHVLQEEKPFLSNSPDVDPGISPEIRNTLKNPSVVAVPIFKKDGGLAGCFELFDKAEGGAFTENDVSLLKGLAASAAVAIENAAILAQRQEAQSEIKARVEELERFYKMAVDREIRMRQLKEEKTKLLMELSKTGKEWN